VAVAVTDDVTVVPEAEHLITVLYASVEQSVPRRRTTGMAAVEMAPLVVRVVVLVVTVQKTLLYVAVAVLVHDSEIDLLPIVDLCDEILAVRDGCKTNADIDKLRGIVTLSEGYDVDIAQEVFVVEDEATDDGAPYL